MVVWISRGETTEVINNERQKENMRRWRGENQINCKERLNKRLDGGEPSKRGGGKDREAVTMVEESNPRNSSLVRYFS